MVAMLDFEAPIGELNARIAQLREAAEGGPANIEAELAKLEARADRMLADTYGKLTPWQKTQVARHPERPHFKHYIARMFTDFLPLAGDRAFGDDRRSLAVSLV